MKRIACFLSLCLIATSAFAQQEPLALGGFGQGKLRAGQWTVPSQVPPVLRKALARLGKLKYSGTRTVESRTGPNRERHVEYVVTDGQRSRIWFPASSELQGQIIVETPKERRHYLPGRNELQIMPPRREQVFERIVQLVNRRLSFDTSAGGKVAGVAAQLVTISDKQGNVLEKLWIDPQSGMILKREMYDRAGSVEAWFEFTEINLNPNINRTDFILEHKGATVVTPDVMLRRLAKRGGFQLVRLPQSVPYVLEIVRVQQIGGQPVLVQHYSGGAHRITLYQLKAAVDPQRLGQLESRDLQVTSWQSGGSTFVLVGDVSDSELQDLARRIGA